MYRIRSLSTPKTAPSLSTKGSQEDERVESSTVEQGCKNNQKELRGSLLGNQKRVEAIDYVNVDIGCLEPIRGRCRSMFPRDFFMAPVQKVHNRKIKIRQLNTCQNSIQSSARKPIAKYASANSNFKLNTNPKQKHSQSTCKKQLNTQNINLNNQNTAINKVKVQDFSINEFCLQESKLLGRNAEDGGKRRDRVCYEKSMEILSKKLAKFKKIQEKYGNIEGEQSSSKVFATFKFKPNKNPIMTKNQSQKSKEQTKPPENLLSKCLDFTFGIDAQSFNGFHLVTL